MRLECDALMGMLKQDFSALWGCYRRGDSIEILTPFPTATQKFVSVFISRLDNEFVVSDGGCLSSDENSYGLNGVGYGRAYDTITQHFTKLLNVAATKNQSRQFFFKKVSDERLLSSAVYDIAHFVTSVVNALSIPQTEKSYRREKLPFTSLISPADEALLAQFTERTEHLSAPIVEIGSYYGASAGVILKSSAKSGRHLFCFDYFEPEKSAEFWKYIASIDVERVTAFCGDFKQVFMPIVEISMAFIDHDHSYENTKAAFELLWPILVPGGLMVFHDYGHADYPGGTKFINETGLPIESYLGIAVLKK